MKQEMMGWQWHQLNRMQRLSLLAARTDKAHVATAATS